MTAAEEMLKPNTASIDKLCIDTIRTLSMDAVQKAESGHPGTPMALAPVIYTLWQRVLRYDPTDPLWLNRDRFVLSNGHASMLLYSILHLTGVRQCGPDHERLDTPSVSLDDIKAFRQLDSRCPGHPEYGHTTGVETTTGPLGQGCGNSVGMAIAERWLSTHFNRPGFTIFDHDVYVLCSDGDLMEGVSSEAASIAGHLMLSNLCWIYDCNTITIEGHTDLTFTEDVAARFLAYGWNVLHVGDANDVERMAEALQAFREHDSTPTLIIVNSHIGYGAPHKQDTSAAHGEPLGEEEVRLAKRRYGWPEDAHFLIPDGVRAHFDAGVGRRGRAARTAWWESYDAYRVQHPDLAAQLDQMARGEAPRGWDADLPVFPADAKGLASRASSAKALADKGVAYVDCGTSGGIWGLDRGYSMMIGGPPEAVARLDPIFAALAPGFGHIPRTPERDGQPSTAERGYIHAGPTGAGHFVKMVHNGIEYGLMQAYAEGFNILRNKNSEDLPEDERYTLNLAEIAEVWRRGSVIASWLLDLGAAALVKDGQLSDYSGYVQDSGEGRWTVEAAIEEAVPVDVLSTALYARFRSRKDHTFAERMLSAMRFGFGGHIEGAEAIDPMPPSPRP